MRQEGIVIFETAAKNARLTVFSLDGKIVLQEKNYHQGQKLTVSDFLPGMYFYRLTSGQIEIKGRFIKE